MRWNMALITKAKAWYAVTYARAFRSSSEFRSFPWIVWDILLIAKRQIVSDYVLFQRTTIRMNITHSKRIIKPDIQI